MKILYITCGSGCDTSMGGSLLRTVETAKRLCETEEVHLLTSSGGVQAIKSKISRKSIIEVKTNIYDTVNGKYYLLKLILSYLFIFFRAQNAIKKIPQVDIIYLDSDGLWDIIPAILYKRQYPKVKIVSMNHHIVSLRTDNPFSCFSSIIYIILQKIGLYSISRIADAIFVLNTNMGHKIKKRYLEIGYNKPIYKISNGVDISSISRIPEQNKRYDACFFGYLRPSKGLYQIIPIWKKVVSEKPNSKLVIIGGMLAHYNDYIQREIVQHGLSNNIICTDYIPNKSQALMKVKQSKICISPSQEEGWGIAIMECMTAGLPCILWNLSIFDNFLKEGVIKIEKYDLNAFSKQIIRLLNDNYKLKELGQKAKESTLKYDWDRISQQDLKFFKEIMSI